MILEFVIAAVDGSPVLISRMPDLGPVPAAALAAFDFTGEDGYAAVTFFPFTPPLDFLLYPIEYLRADDSFMVMFHIILWHFPFIFLCLFCQKINRDFFLKQGIPFILFIHENTSDRVSSPDFATSWSGNLAFRQFFCNRMKRVSVKIQTVNQLYDFCLLFIHYQVAIHSLIIPKKMSECQTDLPISKPFPVSPSHILRDAAALFLCQRTHNRNEEFPFCVQCPDIFLFKIDFNPFIFQFSHGGQAVHRIPGKPADRFCDDKVNFAGYSIRYHSLKSFPVFGIRS